MIRPFSVVKLWSTHIARFRPPGILHLLNPDNAVITYIILMCRFLVFKLDEKPFSLETNAQIARLQCSAGRMTR